MALGHFKEGPGGKNWQAEIQSQHFKFFDVGTLPRYDEDNPATTVSNYKFNTMVLKECNVWVDHGNASQDPNSSLPDHRRLRFLPADPSKHASVPLVARPRPEDAHREESDVAEGSKRGKKRSADELEGSEKSRSGKRSKTRSGEDVTAGLELEDEDDDHEPLSSAMLKGKGKEMEKGPSAPAPSKKAPRPKASTGQKATAVKSAKKPTHFPLPRSTVEVVITRTVADLTPTPKSSSRPPRDLGSEFDDRQGSTRTPLSVQKHAGSNRQGLLGAASRDSTPSADRTRPAPSTAVAPNPTTSRLPTEVNATDGAVKKPDPIAWKLSASVSLDITLPLEPVRQLEKLEKVSCDSEVRFGISTNDSSFLVEDGEGQILRAHLPERGRIPCDGGEKKGRCFPSPFPDPDQPGARLPLPGL